MTTAQTRPLAVVTGASSGIGLHLAQRCAVHGYDVLLAADQSLDHSAATCRSLGSNVETLLADLSTTQGVVSLVAAIAGRPVAALLANAGQILGHGFWTRILLLPVRCPTPTSPARCICCTRW